MPKANSRASFITRPSRVMLPRCSNMLRSRHNKRLRSTLIASPLCTTKSALIYAGVLAPEQRADLLEHRSYECYVTGQISDACEARQQALEIWQQVGNKLRQGDNLDGCHGSRGIWVETNRPRPCAVKQ